MAFNLQKPPNTHFIVKNGLRLYMRFASQVALKLQKPSETQSGIGIRLGFFRVFAC